MWEAGRTYARLAQLDPEAQLAVRTRCTYVELSVTSCPACACSRHPFALSVVAWSTVKLGVHRSRSDAVYDAVATARPGVRMLNGSAIGVAGA